MPDRLGERHAAGWNLVVLLPEMEDDPVRFRSGFSDLFGFIDGFDHLDSAGLDFDLVIMVVTMPHDQRNLFTRKILGHEILNCHQLRIGVGRVEKEALQNFV